MTTSPIITGATADSVSMAKGRAPSGQALAVPAEPSCTVSALTGYDPSRKEDAFKIELDTIRRKRAMEDGEAAAKALGWLLDFGTQWANGSSYGTDFRGHEEAKLYLEVAHKHFAFQMRDYAVRAAQVEIETKYAIATEARRAATGNTDAVEDEGAGRRHCPNNTPLDREGE